VLLIDTATVGVTVSTTNMIYAAKSRVPRRLHRTPAGIATHVSLMRAT